MPLPALVLALLGRLRPVPLANARIYLVRHAEKPDEGNGLTPAGERRAKAYATYFRRDPLDGRPMRLTHVFAAADSGKSARPRLTAEPVAGSLGQRVDLRFENKSPKDLARELRRGSYGDRILVVWHHGAMPKLLSALGADPGTLLPGGKWPEDVYDRVVVLRYDAQGRLVGKASRWVAEPADLVH